MTISWQVQQQILAARSPTTDKLFFVPLSALNGHREAMGISASTYAPDKVRTRRRASHWTDEEHERFLQGLELFPSGPWKEVAAVVGSKTTRQTMTHAQKYRQKMERRIKLAVNLQEMAKEASVEHDLFCEAVAESKLIDVDLDSQELALTPLNSPLDVSTDLDLGDYDFLSDFVDLLA